MSLRDEEEVRVGGVYMSWCISQRGSMHAKWIKRGISKGFAWLLGHGMAK